MLRTCVAGCGSRILNIPVLSLQRAHHSKHELSLHVCSKTCPFSPTWVTTSPNRQPFTRTLVRNQARPQRSIATKHFPQHTPQKSRPFLNLRGGPHDEPHIAFPLPQLTSTPVTSPGHGITHETRPNPRPSFRAQKCMRPKRSKAATAMITHSAKTKTRCTSLIEEQR